MHISRFPLVLAVLLSILHVSILHASALAEEKAIIASETWLSACEPPRCMGVQYAHQAAPVYPRVLRMTGNKGKVLLKALVSEQGKVQEMHVIESSHFAFEQATVRAVANWRFIPAVKDTVPFASWVLLPIQFSLTDAGDSGVTPYSLPPKQKANVPADLRYDSPPSVKVVAPLVYPIELLKKGITGSAKVSVLVDPNGDVHEVKILEASHPEFGLATRAMMQSWEFKPASKEGHPTWGLFIKNQKFDEEERDTYLDGTALRLLKKSATSDADIHALNELDAIPNAFYQPLPVYPDTLKQNKVADNVMVEFYIDPNGMVQFPHVLKYENEELAWLALTAVQRWQFEPPKLNGKPVYAIATVPVRFN